MQCFRLKFFAYSQHLKLQDRPPCPRLAIVPAIRGADPDIILQAICNRLEATLERTRRRRTRWQPSSVKMLLEQAERLGLLQTGT